MYVYIYFQLTVQLTAMDVDDNTVRVISGEPGTAAMPAYKELKCSVL